MPVRKLNKDRTPGKRATINTRQKRTISRERNKPSQILSQYPIIIHGELGIGKTTLTNQLPKMYCMMFEPNDSYPYYFDNVRNWVDFKDLKEDFLLGDHDYLGIDIDNGSIAYDYAMAYACDKMGIEHPGGQNDFGQSWDKVKLTFINGMRDLMNSPYGFIVNCHTVEKELTTLSGEKYNKLAPNLPKQAYEFLCYQIPNIFYYHYVKESRWLQIVGDEHIVAKNKMKGHFISSDGEPVYKIPMGNSEEEAYENLMKAFNNEQERSYKTTFTKRKSTAKRKVKRKTN